MPNSSIHLKAYRCQDGREIHYAAARLRRDPSAPAAAASILDADEGDGASSAIGHCVVFFYPMGPNRRLLEAVVARCAPHFDGDEDALFLCANRPGKGGTSSAPDVPAAAAHASPVERQHVRTSVNDVVALLDHYGVATASLLYMCAGSTYAYAFAATFPARTTGCILGISSWVLRAEPSASAPPPSPFGQGGNGSENAGDGDDQRDGDDVKTPHMHSLTHRMAMRGVFGPKRMVSYLAGGIAGSMPAILGSIPPAWVGNQLKKGLSYEEALQFDEQYPDGEEFAEMLNWIHADGCDAQASVFVNGEDGNRATAGGGGAEESSHGGNVGEGDARDIAVCLSTQQDLGMVYKRTVPARMRVRLWHGREDRMLAVAGARYLAAMLPHAALTEIPGGTHQGVMFFFPADVMEALNRVAREGDPASGKVL